MLPGTVSKITCIILLAPFSSNAPSIPNFSIELTFHFVSKIVCFVPMQEVSNELCKVMKTNSSTSDFIVLCTFL